MGKCSDYGRLKELHEQALHYFDHDGKLADLQKQMLHELEASPNPVPERYFVALTFLNSLFIDGERKVEGNKEWLNRQMRSACRDDAEEHNTLNETEEYLTVLKSVHDSILDDECTLKKILGHLDKEYGIQMVYNAGSGHDRTPKETLGENRVVHLSLEENQGYFEALGTGIKVIGDYRFSPFKDKSFDVTLMRGLPPESAMKAVGEFRRVSREYGLLVVMENCGDFPQNFDVLCCHLGSAGLDPIGLPLEYSTKRIAVFQNKPAPKISEIRSKPKYRLS